MITPDLRTILDSYALIVVVGKVRAQSSIYYVDEQHLVDDSIREEIVYDFKDSHQPSWLPSPSNNFSDLHKLKSVHTAASTRYYPKP